MDDQDEFSQAIAQSWRLLALPRVSQGGPSYGTKRAPLLNSTAAENESELQRQAWDARMLKRRRLITEPAHPILPNDDLVLRRFFFISFCPHPSVIIT
jgi:hypothetical protein